MALLRRIGNLFLRSRVEREIDAELRAHVEMRTEDNIAAGMSRQEARREAQLLFGNTTALKERVTGMDVALALDGIWADLRYAVRQLRKNPGFAATAISVLALGVCASVAIFAFVDAVLIKPLPYRDPSRLVALFESTPLGPRFHFSYLDYLDWKKMNSTLSSLEAYDNTVYSLQTAIGVERTDGAVVSAGFLRTLGVEPALGRDFRAGEDTLGAPQVMLLSYGAWQKRYGGRSDVLGQSVMLDGTSFTVVGVLPQSFSFAGTGQAEFWTALQAKANADGRGEHWLSAMGRMKDGVRLETVAAEMSEIAARLAKEYPDSDQGRGATVLTLTEVIVGNLRPLLLVLLGGALLLLLIACVNVSSLLLVRSEHRRREIAVRGALGASRARLARQFVTEGLTLVAAGSVIGVAAAYGAMHLLTGLLPASVLVNMPYLRTLGVNGHVALFAGAVALVMAILFSITPLARLANTNLREGLPEGNRGAAGVVWKRLGANLVILELCTAVVLLSAAGLLGKSFYRLLHADLGMEPGHLAMLALRSPHVGYEKDVQLVALAHRVREEASRLPGVQSAAVARQVPVSNVNGGNSTFEIVGRPVIGAGYEATNRQAGAGYFRTMGARLEQGRYFTEADDATKPLVMIVNRTFARRFFPGEDPVGKQIRFDSSQPPLTIAGIVGDIREGPLDLEVSPAMYTPFDQGPDNSFYVVARVAQDPHALLATLDATVRAIDPRILTMSAETMDDRIGETQSAAMHRASAWLTGGFAVMALVLGIVGLYGVIAYSVSQRTREIGVRMALGAERSSVHRMVLGEAGRLTAVGIAAGLFCSVGTAMLMRNLLFGTVPWDAEILGAVSVVLGLCAMLASYVPARRAASVNPVDALRAE